MSKANRPASRRSFLKGAAGGTLATSALAGGVPNFGASPARAQTAASGPVPEMRLLKHPTIAAEPGSEAFWQEVRDAFPLPQNYIHMNTGTTGSQPTFAQNNLAVYNHYKSANPRDWRKDLAADFPDLFLVDDDGSSSIEHRQAAIAAMYGANEDEIVLSYNTTDGCNMIFAGTPWKEGDRIVTTNLEHPAMLGPIRWARGLSGGRGRGGGGLVTLRRERQDDGRGCRRPVRAGADPAPGRGQQAVPRHQRDHLQERPAPAGQGARRAGSCERGLLDHRQRACLGHAAGRLPRLRGRLHRRRRPQVALRRTGHWHPLRPQPGREPAALRNGQLLPLQRGVRGQPGLEPIGPDAGARRV